MNPTQAHHLGIGPEQAAGNDGRGRIALLPGSVGRAARIADHFSDHQAFPNDRRLDVHLGTLRHGEQTVDVMSVPSGMGGPSLGIVVTELVALGVTRILRIGTAGTMQPESPLGGLCITTGAVRDEGASDAVAPIGFPSMAHPDWVTACTRAAVALGEGERTIRGIVHSKDSLYQREWPSGPLQAQNAAYMQALIDLVVVATEMEASHLFALCAALGRADLAPVARPNATGQTLKAGAVLALIGSAQDGIGTPELARDTEARAVALGVRAAMELLRLEDDGA